MRTLRPNLAVRFIALLLASCMSNESTLRTVTDHATYRAGQVWRYATRPGEETSTFTILRVESHPRLGTIIHIRVTGLRLKNSGGEIGHMPFAEAAIAESHPLRWTEGPAPELPEGYGSWREAFDTGQAGIFTVPIAEGVSVVDQALPATAPQ